MPNGIGQIIRIENIVVIDQDDEIALGFRDAANASLRQAQGRLADNPSPAVSEEFRIRKPS